MLIELYNIVYVPTFYFNIGYKNLNSSGRKTPVCLLFVICGGVCGDGGFVMVGGGGG